MMMKMFWLGQENLEFDSVTEQRQRYGVNLEEESLFFKNIVEFHPSTKDHRSLIADIVADPNFDTGVIQLHFIEEGSFRKFERSWNLHIPKNDWKPP